MTARFMSSSLISSASMGMCLRSAVVVVLNYYTTIKFESWHSPSLHFCTFLCLSHERTYGDVAQLVERTTFNRECISSILIIPITTIISKKKIQFSGVSVKNPWHFYFISAHHFQATSSKGLRKWWVVTK